MLVYPLTIDSIYRGVGPETCRAAVLFPLIASVEPQDSKPRFSVIPAYARVRRMWHSRLHALAEAGWESLQAAPDHEAGYRYTCVGNCPPFGARVFPPRGRPCARARVCPFCFARRVVHTIYRSLEWGLYRQYDHLIDEGLRVMCVKRTIELNANDTVETLVNSYLHNTRRLRILNLCKGVRGSLILSLFEPGQGDVFLRAHRTTFVIDKAGGPIPEFVKGTKFKVLEPAEMTKTALGKVVVWGVKYPVGMMFGDAETTVKILDACHGKKMFTTTGILRNRTLNAWVKSWEDEPAGD